MEDIAVRVVEFMRELVENPDMPLKEFMRNLSRWNEIVFAGEKGDSFYTSGYDIYRPDQDVDPEEAAELVHLSGKYNLKGKVLIERLEIMFKVLKNVVSVVDQDLRGIIMSPVQFFGEHLKTGYIFHGGNNSLIMNVVNRMLRLRSLKGIQHYCLDTRPKIHPDGVLQAVYLANRHIVPGYLGP
jgi:hypothetical protein